MASDYHSSQEQAWLQYNAGFHLMHVTFPLVKDPKLLLGIVNNIFTACEHAIDAMLGYERQLQLVPPYSDTFSSKFNTFRSRSVQRNKINPSYIQLISEMKELIDLHKRSAIEFKRGGKFVICAKDYHMKYVSASDIKQHLDKAKEFLDIMDNMLNRKE